MQWVADSLKYDQPVEEAGIFTLKDNVLGIKIHHYRGLDGWFLTCHALGIDARELSDVSFDDAVDRTRALIAVKIRALTKDARRFLDDDSENEMVRY